MASVQYVDDIITEYAFTDEQKRLLFGIGGSTLAFAIDTTGSMGDVIAIAQQESIALASERLGTPDEPAYYVVSPFNDPTTGPVYKTTDFNNFTTNINSLFAFGGGDCPELAMAGMLNALNVMGNNSVLFVMTDAAPKDVELEDEVINLAISMNIEIYIYKFDSDCDDGLAASKRSLTKRRDSVSDSVYAKVAESTGGSYHSLPRTEASSIATTLSALTLSDSVGIFKISDTLNTSTASYDLPVDSAMTQFTISLQGVGVSLNLTKPDGTPLDTTSSNVNITITSDGEFIKVANPTAGFWKVVVSGNGAFSLDARGVSSLHFSSFDFVETRGRFGHTGYYPITTQPAYDHDIAAVAYLEGDFSTATFDLRGTDNSHVIDANMTQSPGEEGGPPSNSFYGEMRLVPGTLLVYCTGVDSAGAPYLRVRPGSFIPLLSNTTITGFNDTDLTAAFAAYSPNGTTNGTNSSVTLSTYTSTLTSTSSTLPLNTSLTWPTGSGHKPTGSGKSDSENPTGSGNKPSYTWPSGTDGPKGGSGGHNPLSTGIVFTHTKYLSEGCDHYTPTVYTTTTVCSGEVTTTVITTSVVVLCPTCRGANYPQHTGSGPWSSVDESIALHGYSGWSNPAGVGGHTVGGGAHDHSSGNAPAPATATNNAHPGSVKGNGGPATGGPGPTGNGGAPGGNGGNHPTTPYSAAGSSNTGYGSGGSSARGAANASYYSGPKFTGDAADKSLSKSVAVLTAIILGIVALILV
jgi:hypothetical protein